MGNCDFKTDKNEMKDNHPSSINKNMFILHYIIGKGGFSRVKYNELKQ